MPRSPRRGRGESESCSESYSHSYTSRQNSQQWRRRVVSVIEASKRRAGESMPVGELCEMLARRRTAVRWGRQAGALLLCAQGRHGGGRTSRQRREAANNVPSHAGFQNAGPKSLS